MNELDIFSGNDAPLRELALFAGAGGGILGGKLLGWETICAVERDAYAAQVLAQRQNDGILKPFPIWSDVQTFDGRPWCGIVDVISGGFPCQDISVAGKGTGITGKRSGLWKEMARIIREIQPRFVFVENSPALTTRGLGVVLGDLSTMGFNAEWGVISASDIGANHQRDRIWILATNTNMPQREARSLSERVQPTHAKLGVSNWWKNPPKFNRVDDGVAYRLDRLKSIGNGQVPAVASVAFNLLREEIK